MQRDVGRITHHPTIVTGRSGRDVKKHPLAEFVNRTVFHRSRCATGKHQTYMLDVAARRANQRTDVNRPLPARLVSGTSDGHAPDANEFEFSFLERSHLIGLFEPLQHRLKDRHIGTHSRETPAASHRKASSRSSP